MGSKYLSVGLKRSPSAQKPDTRMQFFLATLILLGVTLGQATFTKETVEHILKEVRPCFDGTKLGDVFDKVINECGLENITATCLRKIADDASVMSEIMSGNPQTVISCIKGKIPQDKMAKLAQIFRTG